MVVEIIPPVVMTLIAGAVDLFFMIKDETGDAKKIIGHGVSALIPIGIVSFLAFNVSFLTSQPFIQNMPFVNDYAIIGALVLILAIITHAKSAVFGKGPGSHEKWIHSFLVAGIVAAGPVIWPFVQPYVPFATGFGSASATP